MSTKHPRQPGSNRPNSSPLMMALEPRIMFDGAAIATAVDAAHTDAKPAGIDAPDHHLAPPPAVHTDLSALATPITFETTKPATEIVFIDGSLPDAQQLQDGVKSGIEVVILDPTHNGLNQIADYLEGREGIDAIHIVSHGHQGEITLGGFDLNQTSLNQQTETLARIGNSLGADGDILLYGCQVGGGEVGNAFITQLAVLTNADIAASVNNTGNANLLADWTLETTTGAIEHNTPFTADLLADYQHVLPTTLAAGDIAVIGLNADDDDSGADLDGDGRADIRWAIMTMVDLDVGTVIHITDAGFKQDGTFYSNAFNEGHLTWTITTAVSAGTVLAMDTADGSNFGDLNGAMAGTGGLSDYGTVSGGIGGTPAGSNTTMPSAGDQIIVYQGTAGTTVGANFIYALNTAQNGLLSGNGVWQTSGTVTTQQQSFLPTGLTNGTTALALTTNVSGVSSGTGSAGSPNYGFDNMVYQGTLTGTRAQLLAAIGNPSNWAGHDTTPFNIGVGGSFSYVSDFTIVQPNAAPAIANLDGDSVAWAGAGNSVTLDSGANASLTDTELSALNSGNGNWSGASLTVQRGTAVAADTFGFNTSGALFTVSGGNLQSGGLTFATYTNTGGVLTVSFTSSGTTATTALVNDVARHITYQNNTPAGDATISFTLHDGATAGTVANVTVTSDSIYVTNTTDTATIDISNGVSFSEAIAIAAADATGTQTIVIDSALAGQTVSTSAATSLGESLTLDLDQVTGVTLSGGTLSIGSTFVLTATNGTSDVASISTTLTGAGGLTKTGAGAVTLSGSNSYTGATSISAGTLTASGGGAIGDSSGITVASGGTLALSNSETIGNLSGAGAITLGANTLTSTITADTTFSGGISGTGGLSVNQTGAATFALTLSGTNTYTGNTTAVNFGWLKLNGDASVSNISSLRVNGNSIITLQSDQTVGSLSSNNANARIQLGTFTLSAGGDNNSTTVAGVVSGTGNLVKQGSGTLTLTGTNTYSGTTTVSAGTLSVASDSNLGSDTVTLALGATLDITGATNIDNAIALSGDATISNSANVTLSGVVTGANTLTKAGASTLTLSNTNTYAGTAVNAGTLSIASDANLGSDAVTLASGSTLAVTGATTIDNAIVLSGAASISASANVTVSGIVSGAGDLTKTGASTLTISGTNTHTGAVNVSAGGVTISGGASIGNTSAVTVASGTTLTLAGGGETIGSLAGAGNVVLGYTLTIGGNNTSTTFSGAISGTGNGIIKAGSGTFTLSGNNSYTGSTTVNAGTLTLSGGSAIANSSAVTVASGATLIVGTTETIGSLAGAGSVVLNSALSLGNNNTSTTFSGVLSSTNGITKNGTGTFTLTGANTYSGTTFLVAGSLSVAGDANLGSGTLTFAGGTLAITGATTIDNTISILGSSTIDTSGAVTASGVLSGSSGLTKAGAGTLTLSNTNTHSGSTTVSAGTLAITGSTASATTVASGGTLAGTGSMSGAVTVQNGGTLAPGVSGAGTLTLGNGLTIQSGGTLAIDIAGATAGSGYDQIVVTGAVDVSSASLAATQTYTAGNGTDFIIIANDASDAITGIFSGVSEGSTITAAGNGTVLTASYIGGTGNDFTLTAPINPAVQSVSASTANGTYKIGDTITITVTFDQAVTVDTTGGSPSLQLETGAVDRTANYVSGSGTTTLTFSYIVQAGDTNADLDYLSTSAFSLNGSTIRDAGSNNANLTLATPGAAGSLGANKNIAVDGVRPTASIVVADTALAVGETSLVTITFNEAVTGFANADLTVANGTLSTVSSSDGGITWTATLTPTSSITDTSNVITLDNTGVQDAVGNAGTGTTDSNNYDIDTAIPNAASGFAAIASSNAIALSWTNPVSDFASVTIRRSTTAYPVSIASDTAVISNSILTSVNDSGLADGTYYYSIFVKDAMGNVSLAATTSATVDTVGISNPTIVVADTALKVGETSLVTITFNEAVTGFTTADLAVANGSISGLVSSDGGVTWTATLTPTASITDTTNIITLDNTGVQDAAGNTGTGTTDSNNYAIDTVRPTASIVVADTALSVGETSLVTITFSEAVTGFSNADLIIANGTLSTVSSSDGGITWTATLTPTASITDTTNVITLDNTGVQDVAGNTGSGTTDSNNYAIDTLRPTVSIVVADTALSAGETSLVTFTFSEAVTGFTTADLTVANGVVSGLSSSDGGITWTGTLTPTANIEDTTNVITLANTGIQDSAGNAGTGTTNSNNYTIDTLRPTATIVVADTALAAGETSLVTITMSEAVANFDGSDLVVANGSLSGLATSDGGITWTATLTPTANITDTTNVITFDTAGVVDGGGNTGIAIVSSNNYAIDTLRPTATIVVADTALAMGETSLVTITFNEAVTGFTNADLTIANGTLSAVSSSDGGITWTATLTPTASISDTTNVITLANSGVTDAAGNIGAGTTDSNNYVVDSLRPTATIVVADTALAAGETSLVTFTFSEAVTGFTNADLTIANGTLSAVSSSDGGITWTATLTPTANVTDTTNLVTLNNAGVQDLAGNAGTGTTDSNNYAIDTLRPTATIVVADTALAAGETSLVTITFSEAVSNFNNADLSVSNGTLSAVSSSDGGITWTATFTPSVNVSNATNLITLANTGVTDAAGNTGTGITSSNNYAIDTLRPSAIIQVADSALAVGETSLVTITFNEAVTGFTNADLNVANGTLSAVSSSDGGITWTATFTPTAGITDSTNIITLNDSGVTDAAGNTGTGTTDSNNYAIDTLRPTATIVVADNALGAGETSLVTITFSEAVTGFTNADLTIANGTLSAVSSSDGGITWTATLTPTANTTDATNLITLINAGVQDAAGNTGTGTTDSNNYAIDTSRPTASIVVADIALAAGETSLVTITFSEAVSNFNNADLSVSNGTLSAVSSSDGGITWTATFTPTVNVSNATNLITLANTGVTDAAGNTGTGSTNSNNYAIDSLRPSAIITVADTALAAGETSLVTITFNEAVNGFTNADLTVANGTLSAVSSSDGGITWMATLTPTANITDATNLITLNNAGVQDAAGNTGTGTTDSNNYAIDTSRPAVTSIALQGTPEAYEQTVNFLLTFSEPVNHVDLNDFSLTTTGNAVGSLSGLQQISDRSWQVTVNNINGNGTIRLDVKNATDISDSANNTLTSGFTTGASFTAQMLPPPPVPVTLPPLVTSTGTDTPIQTPVSAALIVIPPDASQIGTPTNNTPLTTVEAPALITLVNTSLSVSGANTSPTSLDTSTPGADPIGVVTATSTGTISAASGNSPLGAGGSFTPGGPAKGPSIDSLSTNADSGLQNLPVIGRAEVQPGVPLYIPLPNTVSGSDASQQVTVDVRMQDGRPLVSWLKFDPVTGSLTGQAPKGFEGKIQILVTVRDSKGNAVSSIVELQVNDRDSKSLPVKENPALNKDKAKPGASIMGKPALNEQFARYGKTAHAYENDALLSAINQLSAVPASARKA